jgi:uncharacterized RDD family membrane protein YckC
MMTIIRRVLILVIIIVPILSAIYGKAYWSGETLYLGIWDLLFNYIFPAIVVILFWFYKSATPGKMVLNLSIVDANTGNKPSIKQFIIRYIGYFISIAPVFLGIIWIGFDKRKQGWHDKLADTVVIKINNSEPVTFENKV